MRNRALKVVLMALAAVGGVVAWQRRNETPPVAPGPRPVDPFMDPAAPVQAPLAEAGTPPPSTTPADVDPTEHPAAGHPAAADEPSAVDADVTGGPATDAGVVAEAREAGDDLTRITGVGPKLESLLHEQGITTYAQLAELDDAGVDDLQARLPGFPGRIRRDDWVGQAKRLMGG